MARFLPRQIQILQQIKGKKVYVGWFDDTYPSGERIADVMYILEYGTAKIPARPFGRLAKEMFNAKRNSVEKEPLRALNFGLITEDEFLKEIGHAIKETIEESMLYGGWAPNAQSTIDKKGFDQPLLDTGFAIDSLRVVVK